MKICGLHDMVEGVRWYYRLWDTSYSALAGTYIILLKLTCSFEYRIASRLFLGVLIFITFMNQQVAKFSTNEIFNP